MTTLRLSEELGPTLVGRLYATQLRERIENVARQGHTVVLDFTGVVVVSPSFADEVFARMDPTLVRAGAVRFENLDEDLDELAAFLRHTRAADAG
jgi:hypothetical protein